MTQIATPRTRELPSRGTLLVSTDLHGNQDDFEALRAIFERERERDRTFWVQLGDVVHGPDAEGRKRRPDLHGYDDRSWEIVDGFRQLIAAHPSEVWYVLGNHDHGHVGGPHPSKFSEDEVEALERRLSDEQRRLLREFFGSALLAVTAPCGLFLSHGVPSDRLTALGQLGARSLDPSQLPPDRAELLREILTSYGQSPATVTRMLAQLSTPEVPLHVVVHGHDRDEAGWYVEGDNQLGLCIFGAPRDNKRYLRADLSARYRSVADLRDGFEIRRLHG